MSLHHGLTDPCDNHFTDSFIFSWFQASSQASLRFCLRAKLTSKPAMAKPLTQTSAADIDTVSEIYSKYTCDSLDADAMCTKMGMMLFDY